MAVRDPAWVARGARRSAVEFARRFLTLLARRAPPSWRRRVTGSQLAYHGYLRYEGLDWDEPRKVADKIQRLARQVGVFPKRFAIYLTAGVSIREGARYASGKLYGPSGKRERYSATMHLTRDPRDFFVAVANWLGHHRSPEFNARLLWFRVHAISDAPKRAPRGLGPVKIGGKRPKAKRGSRA